MVGLKTALSKKLLREAWLLKGQIFSISMVVATGVMSVITMRGSYDSLVLSQAQYYQESHFADVWSSLVRAPTALKPQLEAIPGIDTVDTRVKFLATLDLDDSGIPAQGLFLSLPEVGRPLLNDIVIIAGRYIEPAANDEVIISKNFALARQLGQGDKLRAILNGRYRELDVVGIAVSAENSYAVPPGSLFPDDERFGIMWMSRAALGPAFDMDGAFNEMFATLIPDANVAAVIENINDMLYPYGGLGAYARKDQPSHLILQGELDQNRVMGSVIPAVFLAVAVFLLHLVLGRLITTQRGEIAVLKAFGYRDHEVGWHFLSFAIIAVFSGVLLGTGGGIVLGGAYMEMYGEYFDFPNLDYKLSPFLLVLAIGSCLLGAFTGALTAVRKAVLLPPAEAMRPEAPIRFRAGILERTGIGQQLPTMARMILRNIERKPVQGFLSSVGVAMSVAILTIGLFMFDGINYMMDLQFQSIQREDLTLTFKEIVDDSVKYDLARLPGVSTVETFRVSPARLTFGHNDREIAIQGMNPEGRLRRIINAHGQEVPVPNEGIILSSLLAKRLTVQRGDLLQVEMLEGRRKSAELTVTGIVQDFLGLSSYMSLESLHRINGDSDVVSGAYLTVEPGQMDSLSRELKQAPAVASVASPDSMLESFSEQIDESILIGVGFLLGFSSVIAIGVIYNGARIALSERERELSSLRVMGFHRREVAILLLGEQALVTLLAIPLGWLLGYGLAFVIAENISTDLYRIPFIIEPRTYVLSAVIVAIAAAASGWIVRHQLDQSNIVDVLKTRE